jgi:hypothetical protein
VVTAAGAEDLYVKVEKARVLKRPSAFAPALTTLPYRTRVQILGKSGTYYQVKTKKGKGYLAKTSVAVSRPVYLSELKGQYLSSDEVAMATKGFNAQVEAEHRQANPKLAYSQLDRWIKLTTYTDPGEQFLTFRQNGALGEFSSQGDKP